VRPSIGAIEALAAMIARQPPWLRASAIRDAEAVFTKAAQALAADPATAEEWREAHVDALRARVRRLDAARMVAAS
jgi:hypothetical protein